jgi:hypothetical protein
VELKLKWPVGSQMVQSIESKQTSETIVPRAPAPVKQEINFGQKFSLKVLREMADGGHELELEFLGMRLSVTAANQRQLEFDSSDKSSATNPAAAAFQTLVGAKLRLFMDASNEVWKVEGAEDLANRLSGGKDPLGVMRSLFNEDYFKQQVMSQNKALPGKPVQPGDTWPVQQEMTLGELGAMTMDFTYTFKSWERRNEHNCARLEYEGTMSGKLGLGTKGTGVKMSFENSKCSGESFFDLESGRFVDGTMNQDMTMLLTAPSPQRRGGPAAPATIMITNIMSQVVTFKMEPAK